MQYFSNSTQAFYNPDFLHLSDMPKDVQKVSDKQCIDMLEKLNTGNSLNLSLDGYTVELKLGSVHTERSWRDYELQLSDIELYKVQDSDPNAVGSVSSWREYRRALRAWPQHKDFPGKDFRPVAPNFKE